MTSPVDAVGPTATLPADYDPSKATVNASGTGKQTEMFDSEMFLNLLVAQLKYQDPTNPVDTSNFMNQTAMLSQVQTMNTMSDTLSDMMAAQQAASATSMIGKAISFVNPSGQQVTGMVDGVSFHSGTAMLHVGDLAVPLAGVLVVADPVVLNGGSTDGASESGGTDAVDGADGADGTDGTGDATDPGENDAVPGDSAADSTDDTGDDAVPVDTTTNPADSGSAAGTTDDGSLAATIRPDTISA
jgi:flagellar basal-body rod modification protein FlgD